MAHLVTLTYLEGNFFCEGQLYCEEDWVSEMASVPCSGAGSSIVSLEGAYGEGLVSGY